MAAPQESLIIPRYVQLAKQWKEERKYNKIPHSYTWAEVIVLPGESVVKSPSQVSLRTRIVNGIDLYIPVVSSNMNTVTEKAMADLMARMGGIGIIHRALSIKEQVKQVEAVKNVTRHIVATPPRIALDGTVKMARGLMGENELGFVVVMEGNKLCSDPL